MPSLRLFFLTAALCGASLAARAQTPADAALEAADLGLAAFARDATAFAALPGQRDALGLSTVQVTALNEIAAQHLPAIHELYFEVRALFEAVATLDRPIDAHEAYALYFDLAMHKAEALREIHAGAEAMRAVLTDTQRAEWERIMEAAAREQVGGSD